jgi:hypothetical protein
MLAMLHGDKSTHRVVVGDTKADEGVVVVIVGRGCCAVSPVYVLYGNALKPE